MLLGRMEAEDEDVDAPPSCIGVLAQLMTSECCCSSHAHSPRLASHPVDVGTGIQPERSWLRHMRCFWMRHGVMCDMHASSMSTSSHDGAVMPSSSQPAV